MVRSIILTIFVIGLCVLFFGLTSPETLHVGLLVVPILLVFASVSMVAHLLIRFALKKNTRKEKGFAVLAGLTAALIVLLQSTGGIVIADALLIVAIAVISYIYLTKF